MKKFAIVNLLLAFVLVLGACGTNNNVVSNHLITKRKYTKGFHLNKKGNLKSDSDTQTAQKENEEKEQTVVFASNKTSKKELKNEARELLNSEETYQAAAEVNREESSRSIQLLDGTEGTGGSDAFVRVEKEQFDSSDNATSDDTAENTTIAKAKKRAASGGGGRSDLVNIILIVLLVCVVITLLSFIGGPLGWILSVVILVLIIYFLLKLLGVI